MRSLQVFLLLISIKLSLTGGSVNFGAGGLAQSSKRKAGSWKLKAQSWKLKAES